MYVDLNKGIIDECSKMLSKELKKEFGRNSTFEIIIVGGASIVLNYHFRETTLDIDALLPSNSSIKDAIRRVADRFHLEDDWLNTDVKYTNSYSSKLILYSRPYKIYNRILHVRTVKEEYLIAMKLKSLRPYKYDMSDVLGILNEVPDITLDKIKMAVINLYGSWEAISDDAREYLENIFNKQIEFTEIKEKELKNRNLLTKFEEKYKDVLNENNVSEILESIIVKESKLNGKNDRKQDIKKLNLF